jgi:PAS domain S-box-containing protein
MTYHFQLVHRRGIEPMTNALTNIATQHIQSQLKQLATMLPVLQEPEQPAGQAWSNLVQEFKHLSQHACKQNLLLETISALANTTRSIDEPNHLLQVSVDLIRAKLDLSYVAIYLLDQTDKPAILKAETSQPEPDQTQPNLSVQIDSQTNVVWAIKHQHPHLTLDIETESGVYSEIVLPLISRQQTVGALLVYSTSQSSFPLTEDDIALMQTLADQVTTAIERTRFFNEAEDNYRFLKTIIEHIPDPIFIKDQNHTLIEMNQANADIIGKPERDLIGKTDHDLFPPDLADKFDQRDNEVFTTNKSIVAEDKTIWADGQEHTAYTRLIPIAGSAKQVEYLLGITQDVTERKAYEAEREQLLAETAALYEGSKAIASARSETELFEAVFTQIRRQNPCEISIFQFHLIEQESVWADLRANWQKRDNPSYPVGTRFYAADTPQVKLLASQEPLFIDDIATDPRLTSEERTSFAPTAACSVAVLPLTATGQDLGAIMVYFTQPYTFTPTTQRLWLSLIDQVCVGLANHQLIQEAAYHITKMETAAKVAQAATSILDLETLLDTIVELIRNRFDLYYVGTFLVDKDKEWAVLRAGTGEAGRKQLQKKHRLKVGGESMIGWSIDHKQPRIALDVGKEAVHFQNPDLPDTHSELALPLIHRDEVIGALTIQSIEQAAFSPEDVIFLQIMANQLANAIQNARLFEQAQQEIIERKLIEREIIHRNEELRFQKTLLESQSEASPDGILVVSDEREILSYNQRFVEMWGIPDEVIALRSSKATLEAIQSSVVASDSFLAQIEYLYKHQDQKIQEEVVLKDGRTFDRYSAPIMSPEGAYYGRIWYFRDITDYKHAQKELVESETRYRGLFEDSPISLWEEDFTAVKVYIDQLKDSGVTDFRTYFKNHPETVQECATRVNIIEVNRATLEMLQADSKAVLLDNLPQVFTEESFQVFQEEIIALAEGKTVFESEATHRTLQGQPIDINLRLSIHPNYEDTWAKVFISLTNITKRKQAEKALRKSEEQYRVIYNNTPALLHSIDRQGQLTNVSNYWLEALGYERDEVIGRRSTEFMTEESRRYAQEVILPEFYKTGHARNISYQFIKKNGEIMDVLLSGAAKWNEEGEVDYSLTVLVDVTKLLEAEKALQEILRQTELFYHISEALATLTDHQAAFETVLGEYLLLLRLDRGGITLLNQTNEYSVMMALYIDGKVVKPDFQFPANEDLIAQYLLDHPFSLVIEDVQNHELTKHNQHLQGKVKSMLLIPLITKGQVIGILGADATEKGHIFTQEEIEMGEAIADQLVIWLENAQLLDETQHRLNLLQIAADVSKVATSILGVDELINASVNLIRNRFDFYYVGLFLVDEARKNAVLRAGTGEAGHQQLQVNHKLEIGGESMIGWCIQHREARIALDVGQDKVHFQNPYLPDTRSEMALPLISRDEAIGALTVQSVEPNAFTDEDITMLQTMADHLANAVINAQLFESITQSQQTAEVLLQETQALQQLSQALAGTLRVNDILDLFFQACTQDIGFEYVQFSLVDSYQHRVRAIAGVGVSDSQIKRANKSLDSSDIMVDIIKTGRTEIITGWDDRFDQELYETEGHADWIRVFTPITLRKENIGLIEAGFNKNLQANIKDSQLRLLRAFIDQTALALDNAQRYEASQRVGRREALIKDIIAKVRSSTDLETILQTTVREVGEAIDGKRSYVHLVPPNNGETKDGQ